jgi:hypothetical protein
VSDDLDDEQALAFGHGNTSAHRTALPPLLPGVARAATEWAPYPSQKHMVSATRGLVMSTGALGSGKSEPGAFMLLRWALRYPRRPDGQPTKWYAIGPDFALLRIEQMPKILEHARRIKGVNVIRRVNVGTDPRIVLIHGQTILFRSATDADRMRGHEIDGAWIDESEKIDERAFRIAFSRLRSTDMVRVVVTGSPEDVPSWNWHMISGQSPPHNAIRAKLLETGSGFFCYRWRSEENLSNKAEVLGTVRAVMDASGQGVALQELEGRYPGTPEAPALGALDFTRAFVGKVNLKPEDTVGAVIGVDLGKQRDFTWLTVLSRTGYVLAMERFNASTPGVPRETFYSYVEWRVSQLIEKWRVPLVKIDTALSGAAEAEFMAKALGPRAKVEGYRTDSPRRKADAIENLGLALARLSVKIPSTWVEPNGVEHQVAFTDYLRRELAELVVTYHQGYRSFDHPAGGHDDGVVSLALCAQGIAVRKPGGGALNYKQPHFPRFFGYGQTEPFGPFGPFGTGGA